MHSSRHKESPHVALVAPAVAREGITKQIANQIMLLQQEDVQVFLIVLAEYDDSVLTELGVRLPVSSILKLKQVTHYLSPKALLKSYSTVEPVLNFLRRNKVSIVVSHAPYAHFVMRIVKLFSCYSSYSFTLYQYFHGLQYAQFPINSLRRYAINKFNQILAQQFDDGHIYISNATKEDVERNLISVKKQVVLYNPIDTEQVIPESKRVKDFLTAYQEAFVIVLPGRLDYNKGQLFFLQVLKQFLCQNNIKRGETIVLLVGAGETENELKMQINKSRLHNFVRIVGELPNIDLRYMLLLSHLVVVPSFIEGLSFVALESLAAGKLLLTSDAGGLREIITHGITGFTFKAGDKKDCLAKLNYIYHNRTEKLIDTAKIEQELKLKFSYEQYKEQLLKYMFSISV